MSSSVKSSVDAVLEQAVASGAVPNVVAIAADRDGIIYEGAVGPRVSGQQQDVDADTHYR
ncbi:MAG: methyl acetate hydrolase, partial [Mycobacterium sp.]|nr:methyl acetate hydrolase [Mycobacterium sp.]